MLTYIDQLMDKNCPSLINFDYYKTLNMFRIL